ncbi:response regulator, partial [bacterium]|nr:response regulator [bacterium]
IVDYEPDVLLLDIMLPKMNAYQHLHSLRSNISYKALPVIVISAKSSQRDQDYALRLGANHFLPKPYRIDQLLKLIQTATSVPGFKVQSKRLSLKEIQDIVAADEQSRQDHTEATVRRRQYEQIRNIANNERPRREE